MDEKEKFKIEFGDFFIVKFMNLTKRLRIPYFLSSILIGLFSFIFILLAGFFSNSIHLIPIGHYFASAWLFFGPYLIYSADGLIAGLWPDLSRMIGDEKVKELQFLQLRFHSKWYLLFGIPGAILINIYWYFL